jgi:hypothetical protein
MVWHAGLSDPSEENADAKEVAGRIFNFGIFNLSIFNLSIFNLSTSSNRRLN